jgi:ATP/maltotriose-dependent transcriptional regulator MalT
MTVIPTTATAEELVRRGRITAALEALVRDPDPAVDALRLTLECRLARGEMELAITLGEELAAAPHRHVDDDARAALALGDLCAATGRDEDALASFQTVERLVGDRDPVAFPWRMGAAVSLIRLGRRPEAEAFAGEYLRLARASGSAYATAGAIRTVAAVCNTLDRLGQLREAHDLASAGEHQRLAAQIATDLAGLVTLMATGDCEREEAIRLLREAEQYADHEDLWPLHSRVRRLLERLGETALVPRSEAVAKLSQAELRIVKLAAVGGTNRSIAEHLGVTVKAVEWHLSHAYRKLGIKGRAGLPRALRLG